MMMGLKKYAIGQSTLVANTSGSNNTAVGGQTLQLIQQDHLTLL